jgi:hypothetical protein
MDIQLLRTDFTKKSTIGNLNIDSTFFCFTLEDRFPEDGIKVKGETCIPAGRYEVVTDWSNRFQRMMPHILNVPGFEGIRIHKGNTSSNTEGCILLGDLKSEDYIGHSKPAFDAFYILLVKGLKEGKVWINIEKEV